MIGCLPTQALAFLAVFVYATHATQAIAFEWKPGLTTAIRRGFELSLCVSGNVVPKTTGRVAAGRCAAVVVT